MQIGLLLSFGRFTVGVDILCANFANHMADKFALSFEAIGD